MRRLFICDTPFQVLNALNIRWNAEKEPDSIADLYIVDQFVGAKELFDCVVASEIFTNVYILHKDERLNIKNKAVRGLINILDASDKTRRLRRQMGIKKKRDLPNYNYDIIYASVLTLIVASMLRLNPTAEFVLFDDGIGSYYGNILDCMGINKHDKLSRLLGRGRYIRQPMSLYVNSVEMCRSTVCEKIMPLPLYDDEFLKVAYSVFSISRNNEWDKPIVFLTTATDGNDKDEIIQQKALQLLKTIANQVIVRIHPRDKNREAYSDFIIDDAKELWELKIQSVNLDEKIIISINSSAQFTPKILFGKEPKLIFLYKMLGENKANINETNETMISDLLDKYSRKDRICIPQSTEEFLDQIHFFINELSKIGL